MTKKVRISLFIDKSTAVYFSSIGTHYSSVLFFKKYHKSKDDDSIMCGFYFIAFIEYMIAGNILLEYTNSFSPNDCQKNDKIISKYFKDKYKKRKFKL